MTLTNRLQEEFREHYYLTKLQLKTPTAAHHTAN
jgi:hypothetical protein